MVWIFSNVNRNKKKGQRLMDDEKKICWLSMIGPRSEVKYCREDCEAYKSARGGSGCEILTIMRAVSWNVKLLADPDAWKKNKR
jgi:hypothetical protein